MAVFLCNFQLGIRKMNDEENKMYSNLADLLNKTLENGEIPKEFVQKEESSEESNEKNLIKNQNSQEKSFKIKIKNIKKKKTQEKHYTILHKYTENIQFPLNIQNALATLDIAYPFSKNKLNKQYRKLCKLLHPDKNNQNYTKITIQESNNVYKTIQLSFLDITNAYKTLLDYFFNNKI